MKIDAREQINRQIDKVRGYFDFPAPIYYCDLDYQFWTWWNEPSKRLTFIVNYERLSVERREAGGVLDDPFEDATDLMDESGSYVVIRNSLRWMFQ